MKCSEKAHLSGAKRYVTSIMEHKKYYQLLAI